MAQQRPDRNGYYTGQHYNVRCEGDILFNRWTVRDLRQIRVEIIQSIWSVEEKRELTRKEIIKLCGGK